MAALGRTDRELPMTEWRSAPHWLTVRPSARAVRDDQRAHLKLLPGGAS